MISPKALQSIAGKGYLSGNRFEIRLSGALSAGAGVTDHLMSATFPTVSYGTIDYRNASPMIKVPNDYIVSPLRLTFFKASDGLAFKHFMDCSTTKIIKDISNNYAFNFFDEYTGDVRVSEFSPSDELVHECTAINAWVSNVEDTELSMENSNIISRFTVTLEYERIELG
jgi:hypothetical protein